MLAKHIVSLYDMCFADGVSFDAGTWDEKITDSLNYLFLLKAIVKRRDRTINKIEVKRVLNCQAVAEAEKTWSLLPGLPSVGIRSIQWRA